MLTEEQDKIKSVPENNNGRSLSTEEVESVERVLVTEEVKNKDDEYEEKENMNIIEPENTENIQNEGRKLPTDLVTMGEDTTLLEADSTVTKPTLTSKYQQSGLDLIPSAELILARTEVQLDESKLVEVQEEEYEEQNDIDESTEKPDIVDTVKSSEILEEKEENVEDERRHSSLRRHSSPRSVELDYQMVSRLPDEEDMLVDTIRRISLTLGLDLEKYSYFEKLFETLEEEEHEEEEVLMIKKDEKDTEKIEKQRLDHLEKIYQLKKESLILSIRNQLYQKEIYRILKRKDRKYRYFGDKITPEVLEAYNQLLDSYEALLKRHTHHRQVINIQIDFMKEIKNLKLINIEKIFDDLQNREREFGTGLIYAKNNRKFQATLLESYITRQKSSTYNLWSLQLKYSIIKLKLAQRQMSIVELDKIDETHSVPDLEQLKYQNFNYVEKLENIENQLVHCKNECKKKIEMLAHVKEVSTSMAENIETLMEINIESDNKILEIRSNINNHKAKKDYYRNRLRDIQIESGLLSHPDLLKDMVRSLDEVKLLKLQLEELQTVTAKKTRQLRNINRFMEKKILKKTYKLTQKPSSKKLKDKILRPLISKPKLSNFKMEPDNLPNLLPIVKEIKTK